MRNGHVAMRGQVLLTKSSNMVWKEKRKEREANGEKGVGFLEREALPSL